MEIPFHVIVFYKSYPKKTTYFFRRSKCTKIDKVTILHRSNFRTVAAAVEKPAQRRFAVPFASAGQFLDKEANCQLTKHEVSKIVPWQS